MMQAKGLRGGARAAVRFLAEQSETLPVVGRFVAAAYERRFNAAVGNKVRLFNGIYPTFEAATRAIPKSRFVGYDNEPSAHRVIDEWLEIAPYDYPVLFWLCRLLPECSTIFDWGGNVGLKYFAYRRYLPYPADLTWWVNDVPAVVELGRRIAEREAAEALRFTTTIDELPGADLLFAAGAVHFIEDPFAMLGRLGTRLPRHFLLSKVPVHQAPSAVTLHNMGTAFCPYHLFNRTEFIDAVQRLGYQLVDEWISPDLACSIPFHPEYSIPAYTGFYFKKDE